MGKNDKVPDAADLAREAEIFRIMLAEAFVELAASARKAARLFDKFAKAADRWSEELEILDLELDLDLEDPEGLYTLRPGWLDPGSDNG